MWIGNFEADKQSYFQNTVKRGDLVWDVGAHIGFYTVLFSKLSGPEGQVVAFEPMSMNVSHLRNHIRLNEINNVTIVQAAVWHTDQLIGFSDGHYDSSTGKVENLSTYQIPSITLDNFWLINGKRGPKLIKIDVEGAEEHVLRGAERMLTAARPVIVLALHGENAATACSNILKSLNYNIYNYKNQLIEDTPKTSEIIAIPRPV
jgi:FkbM family methyltransferase